MTRPLATTFFVVLVPVVWWLMWLGWRRRGRAQGELPAPSRPADLDLGPDPVRFEGVYVSTTRHGDWLDRVVAHGLGTRSEVAVVVGPAGVVLERRGAPSVAVPREDLQGATTAAGIAGKVVERDGLAVIRWRLGGWELDSGLRLRHAEDTARLVAAINELVGRVEA